ncbi:DUF2946 family protein [Ruegeria marisrubri]|nr:DUF2946 family protein [Ruegeria marisrubri]
MFQTLAGVVGVLLLLLQSFLPTLASADEGEWMEICSEAGPVLVQVDLEDDSDGTAPCPDCASCILCAASGPALMAAAPELARPEVVQIGTLQGRDVYKPYNPAQFWPDNRGPPCASQNRNERAPRASTASTQVTGGALWS